tara:strand:- start:44704 stop:44826 length:123 start_codon:yes stop_codon:yes gene_type:complete
MNETIDVTSSILKCNSELVEEHFKMYREVLGEKVLDTITP